jgi:hypothetical protein
VATNVAAHSATVGSADTFSVCGETKRLFPATFGQVATQQAFLGTISSFEREVSAS